jgi:hypothetical protein
VAVVEKRRRKAKERGKTKEVGVKADKSSKKNQARTEATPSTRRVLLALQHHEA